MKTATKPGFGLTGIIVALCLGVMILGVGWVSTNTLMKPTHTNELAKASSGVSWGSPAFAMPAVANATEERGKMRLHPSQMDANAKKALASIAAQAKGKPAMVAFYATWCSSCKRLEPIEERIAQDSNGKLALIRLNIDAPENRALAGPLHIRGTPTYLLLGRDGQIQYRMEGILNTMVLASLAQKLTGEITPLTIADGGIGKLNPSQKPYVFVAVHPEQCLVPNPKKISTDCHDAHVFEQYVQDRFGGQVTVAEISNQSAAGKGLLKAVRSLGGWGYILMDKHAVPLLSNNSKMDFDMKVPFDQFVRVLLAATP